MPQGDEDLIPRFDGLAPKDYVIGGSIFIFVAGLLGAIAGIYIGRLLA